MEKRNLPKSAASTDKDSGDGSIVRALKDNPTEALELLDSALIFAVADGSFRSFLLSLRDVVHARGTEEVASEVDVSIEHLNRVLSGNGDTELDTILALLKFLKLRFAIAPLTDEEMAYAASG